jgi:adenine-specific DNA-methyltransferase
MTNLVSHQRGSALEPSAGEGHLAAALHRSAPDLAVTSVEIDTTLPWNHTDLSLVNADFFEYTANQHGVYDVVFGNPPYVTLSNTEAETRDLLEPYTGSYQGKVNLYQLFFDRCIDLLKPGGELVFIIPGEWVYATSAAPLREKIRRLGAITDFIHCGEERLFTDASVPFISIVRFVRDLPQGEVRYHSSFDAAHSNKAADLRTLVVRDSRWMLLPNELAVEIRDWGTLRDQFSAHVGLVSGCDDVFLLKPGSKVEPDCRLAQMTSERVAREFLFLDRYKHLDDAPPRARAYVRRHKKRLMDRKIRAFSTENFWQYGAVRNLPLMDSAVERFFALVKTRSPEPFFMSDQAKHFTGAVLGIFRLENAALQCEEVVSLLNSTRYRSVLESMLLVSGEKVSLQPATLLDVPLPRDVATLRAFLDA